MQSWYYLLHLVLLENFGVPYIQVIVSVLVMAVTNSLV